MKLLEKINFKEPKYMLPAIIFIPLLFTGYFVIDMFQTKKLETVDDNLQTTEYLNPNLPSVNLGKKEEIGSKYENMKEQFGKIQDLTGVATIDRDEEEETESYESRYSEEEKARMEAEARAREEAAKQQLTEQQRQDSLRQAWITAQKESRARQDSARAELERALEDARMRGMREAGLTKTTAEVEEEQARAKADTVLKSSRVIQEDQPAVMALSEQAETQVAVKVQAKASSEYFNSLEKKEPAPKLIKAIIDENLKVEDGSRIRLRLLDEVEVGGAVLKKGAYLYATVSGVSSGRVKGTISSILVDDELIKVNLSLYDNDGLEGLYVPNNTVRETAKDIAGSAASTNVSMSGSYSNSIAQAAYTAAQQAYQRTAQAIGKAIKKSKVLLKYGTFVYVVNGQDVRGSTGRR